MTLARWLRSIFASQTTRKSPPSRRLSVEPLEDRTTPSTAGVLDPTFGTGGVVTNYYSGHDFAWAVLVQPDGKIVTAGQTYSAQTSTDFLVGRYNANGTLDTTFGSGGRAVTDFNAGVDNAYAVALQPGKNGKIVAGGYATITTGKGAKAVSERDFALARYNPNGTLDTTFGNKGKVVTSLGPGYNMAFGMVVQPDGRIIQAGFTEPTGSGGPLALVRYTASGALDPTFGSGGKLVTNIAVGFGGSGQGHPVAVSLQADGRIVVTGTTSSTSATPDFLLARFNTNGSPDTGFGAGSGRVTTDFGGRADSPSSLVIQSDGRIVVSGASQGPGGDVSPALARYNADGTLDASFGAGGTLIAPLPPPSDPSLVTGGVAEDVAIQTDGRLVVAGEEATSTVSGNPVAGSTKAIAERFNADGTVDTSYGPAGTGVTEVPIGDTSAARSLTIQPDGKVVAAGQAQYGNTVDVALFWLLASAPQIGSFTATPNPVSAGSPVTLTLGNLTDGNAGATLTQVAFYLDSNGDGKLDPATDTLLGYGTQNSDGSWSYSFDTTGLASGSYTLFAQARDSYGAIGDPIALALTVQSVIGVV